MQSIVLDIRDDSKITSLLALLRDLSYVDIRPLDEHPHHDVYAGISSKLDDDLLQSQLDVLEKVEW